MLSLIIADNHKYGIKTDPFRLTVERIDAPDSDCLVEINEKTLSSHLQLLERNIISFDNNDYFVQTLSIKQPCAAFPLSVNAEKMEELQN